MQSAEVRDGDDVAMARFSLARQWRVALETQVRTRLVVVGRVVAKDTDEVPLAEGDDVVGAFPSRAMCVRDSL